MATVVGGGGALWPGVGTDDGEAGLRKRICSAFSREIQKRGNKVGSKKSTRVSHKRSDSPCDVRSHIVDLLPLLDLKHFSSSPPSKVSDYEPIRYFDEQDDGNDSLSGVVSLLESDSDDCSCSSSVGMLNELDLNSWEIDGTDL